LLRVYEGRRAQYGRNGLLQLRLVFLLLITSFLLVSLLELPIEILQLKLSLLLLYFELDEIPKSLIGASSAGKGKFNGLLHFE
jgi:uncharacterized membrane protein